MGCNKLHPQVVRLSSVRPPLSLYTLAEVPPAEDADDDDSEVRFKMSPGAYQTVMNALRLDQSMYPSAHLA